MDPIEVDKRRPRADPSRNGGEDQKRARRRRQQPITRRHDGSGISTGGRGSELVSPDRWLFSAIMDDGSASVFCFTPLRVPVSELAPVAACPPSHSPSSESVCSAPPLPLGPCPVCPRLEQEFEAFRQAAYWKAMHGRALQREAQLKVENERLQALLRLREQQLFGRKTETSAATAPAASDAPHADSPPRQPRGQQRGRPSPKRRDYS